MAKSKKKKGKWRKEGDRWVATISTDGRDLFTAERRSAATAAHMFGKRTGAGGHGGNVDRQTRRSRRDWDNKLRQGRYDD